MGKFSAGSGGATRRLFYALLLPESVQVEIEEEISRLGRHDIARSIRWTPRKNLHLTLRFLGELDTEMGLGAESLPGEENLPGGIRLQIGSPDAFPSFQQPRVLVLAVCGIDDDSSKSLFRLQKKLEERAEEIGLEPEKRKFRPHITLGRVRRGARPSDGLLEAFRSLSVETGPILVQRLSLMESHLGREGAEYHEVHSWQLLSTA